MGSCLSGPEPIEVVDIDSPGAKTIHVTLTSGMKVPVVVVPGNTMRSIHEKITHVYGKQPKVVFRGQLINPFLNVQQGKHLIPIRWDATIGEVGVDNLKYSNITDKLESMKNFTNAHWAFSNAPDFINNVSLAF